MHSFPYRLVFWQHFEQQFEAVCTMRSFPNVWMISDTVDFAISTHSEAQNEPPQSTLYNDDGKQHLRQYLNIRRKKGFRQ